MAGSGLGMEAVEAVGGRERQAASRRLEPGQDHAAGCAVKKALKPSRKRVLIDELRNRYRAGLRKTCALLRRSRTVYVYQSCARDSSLLLCGWGNRCYTGALRLPARACPAQAGRP